MENLESLWHARGREPQLLLDPRGAEVLAYLRVQDGGAVPTLRWLSDGTEESLLPGPADCAELAALGGEAPLVVFNRLVDGLYQLFSVRPGETPLPVTAGPAPAICPALARTADGTAWLAYQAADGDGVYQVWLRRRTAEGWSAPRRVSDLPGNNWSPDLVACEDGRLAVAWDGYAAGSYDVYLRFVEADGTPGSLRRLSADDRFHAHVSLAPAPGGGVWAAWNRGTAQWGQDNEPYRRTRIFERNFLHVRRFLEVRRVTPAAVYPVHPVLQDDHLDAVLPGQHHERPRLAAAPDGRLVLGLRYNAGEPSGGHRNDQRWQAVVLTYDGARWSPPVELQGAHGLSTGGLALLPGGEGACRAAAAGEGAAGGETDLQTRVRLYDLPPAPGPVCHHWPAVQAETGPIPTAPAEAAPHRLERGGKGYRLCFGDTHRHTEFSFCRTCIDGSLEEAFRYARDAAGMHFCMTADHDNQEAAPDLWNEVMRAADRFHVPGHFVPFFGYEWIGSSRNRRHRNIVSAQRLGPPDFSFDAPPSAGSDAEEVNRDLGKTLATLPAGKALVVAHHTASNMSLRWGREAGESWDREWEPVVEIFQASRGSSEHPGCPTLVNHFYTSGIWSANFSVDEGWVSRALAQGMRMGFIASSDHMSTHESYACVYAEECSRESIMEALRARRCYAASDRILCEFSIGEAFMGEEIPCPEDEVEVRIRFRGTAPAQEVTLLRDSQPFRSWRSLGTDVELRLTLPPAQCRGHYFYARLQQRDSNLCWSSPIWLD